MKKKTESTSKPKARKSLFSIENEEPVKKTPKRAKLQLVDNQRVVRNFTLIQGGKA